MKNKSKHKTKLHFKKTAWKDISVTSAQYLHIFISVKNKAEHVPCSSEPEGNGGREQWFVIKTIHISLSINMHKMRSYHKLKWGFKISEKWKKKNNQNKEKSKYDLTFDTYNTTIHCLSQWFPTFSEPWPPYQACQWPWPPTCTVQHVLVFLPISISCHLHGV